MRLAEALASLLQAFAKLANGIWLMSRALCAIVSAIQAGTNATLRAGPPSVPLSFIGFEAGVDVQTGGASLGYSRGAMSHR